MLGGRKLTKRFLVSMSGCLGRLKFFWATSTPSVRGFRQLGRSGGSGDRLTSEEILVDLLAVCFGDKPDWVL